MSKKLINNPEQVVDEALEGLVATQPGLQLLAGHRVVLRTDTHTLATEGKVTLLSGGGSGHEPAHAGYVGRGMLTAAVAGAVFASPPPASILAALRAIRSPAGTLMIVKNYTGDRLNFGIALERAKSEGMKVAMVIVGEDCALPDTGKSAGRRGLCGTILVHKVAGAMAEQGCSLEEITATAEDVANNIGTMSVSLSPCSVPGHKPSFSLEEDEMELGLGIHGEAGAERTKLQPADAVAERMLKHISSEEPGYQYFKCTPGMEVALVVNNLGGTSNLELSIMANGAIRYLVDKMQMKVTRVYMGSLMTSLEMAGVSLTLLKIKGKWTEYLDSATVAAGWPNASVGLHGDKMRVDKAPRPCKTSETGKECGKTKEATTAVGLAMKRCVERVCEVLRASEGELNDLDRGSGDADCGSTLKAGADAIQQGLSTVNWDSPQVALMSIAGYIENHMGGTSGALYTLFLTAGAGALSVLDTSEPLPWSKALQEGMQAIVKYGGAKVGDRTMLDALHPAVEVLTQELPNCTRDKALEVLKKAVEAAKVGVAATTKMDARAGRASYVHSSQLNHPDPGAHAVALWLGAIYEALKQ